MTDEDLLGVEEGVRVGALTKSEAYELLLGLAAELRRLRGLRLEDALADEIREALDGLPDGDWYVGGVGSQEGRLVRRNIPDADDDVPEQLVRVSGGRTTVEQDRRVAAFIAASQRRFRAMLADRRHLQNLSQDRSQDSDIAREAVRRNTEAVVAWLRAEAKACLEVAGASDRPGFDARWEAKCDALEHAADMVAKGKHTETKG